MPEKNQRDVARELLLRTAPKSVEDFDNGKISYDEAVGVALDKVCDRLDALEGSATDPSTPTEPSEPAPPANGV